MQRTSTATGGRRDLLGQIWTAECEARDYGVLGRLRCAVGQVVREKKCVVWGKGEGKVGGCDVEEFRVADQGQGKKNNSTSLWIPALSAPGRRARSILASHVSQNGAQCHF